MPAVVVLVVLVAAALVLVRLSDGKGAGDLPARIVTTATNRLPADRRDWGQAMVAELFTVHGLIRRWRFAVGVLHIALFPPPRHPRRVLAVAVVGLLIAAAATALAQATAPGLSVFAASLGLLLCGYTTILASRSEPPRRSAGRVSVAVVALAGLVAAAATAVAVVARVDATHPTPARDYSTQFGILFALLLTGYLALAVTPPRLRDTTNTALWWAAGGALAAGAAWIGIALSSPVDPNGIQPLLNPVVAGSVLAVSLGAAATTRTLFIGVRAGLLTAILAAPIHFTVDLTAMLHLGTYTLTDPYDITAYAHSGYHDVASYLLSDRIGGDIATLVVYPITTLALALLAASAGNGLRRLTTRRNPRWAS
ncbi:MAG TPA: hypothetical protein VJT31_16865 [Rugosimonospora sp.]|nr:hypothetical protein [Rugosimonospora sp.]